jgi:type I restriction enzyme S subunit
MKANWELTPLGLIAPANGNGLPKRSETVWNLSLDEIEPVTGRILKRTFCKVENLGSTKCCFDSRHVLYSKLRPYLNKVAMPDKSGVGTSELIPLLPDCSRLDREFLSLYLRSPYFLDFAKANTRGANLPRISMAELWKHQIPVPPLEEQRRIVARIKECMERVEEIERLCSEANAEREALFESALHKRFDEIRSSFGAKKLEDVTIIRGGASLPKGRPERKNGDVLLVKVAEMNLPENDRIISVSREYSDAKLKPKAVIQIGAIIFPKRGGAIATNKKRILGQAAFIDPNLMAIEAQPNQMMSEFLYYWSRTLDLRSISNGGVIPQLNRKDLAPLEIPVPDLAEQERLSEEFKTLETNCTLLTNESKERDAEVSHLRDAILRKAFAGEL